VLGITDHASIDNPFAHDFFLDRGIRSVLGMTKVGLMHQCRRTVAGVVQVKNSAISEANHLAKPNRRQIDLSRCRTPSDSDSTGQIHHPA
jgi:hypothetical protein